MKEAKEYFPPFYQSYIGIHAKKKLHDNSKELVQLLKDNDILKDNLSIFELGAGPCRNLSYIYKENNTIKLYANDLWKNASFDNMDNSIKEIINFYEADTLSLLRNNNIKVDLMISSDHLMHIKDIIEIMKLITNKWRPNYLLLREYNGVSKKDFVHVHDYNSIENYDLIYETSSKQNSAYKIILNKKNDRYKIK